MCNAPFEEKEVVEAPKEISNPPFGYVKDEKDKDKWLIDETAAEVVRYIFKLCESGKGPFHAIGNRSNRP